MRGRRCCAGEGNLILTYLLVTLITLPIFVLTTPEITAGICGTLWPVNSLLNVVNSPLDVDSSLEVYPRAWTWCQLKASLQSGNRAHFVHCAVL